MNELVWPVVIVIVAVLAFFRLKPKPPPMLRRVKKLEARVKFLNGTLKSVCEDYDEQLKSRTGELEVIKKQVEERLNAFTADMTMLKGEFSSIRTKAALKAVVETAKDRVTGT